MPTSINVSVNGAPDAAEDRTGPARGHSLPVAVASDVHTESPSRTPSPPRDSRWHSVRSAPGARSPAAFGTAMLAEPSGFQLTLRILKTQIVEAA